MCEHFDQSKGIPKQSFRKHTHCNTRLPIVMIFFELEVVQHRIVEWNRQIETRPIRPSIESGTSNQSSVCIHVHDCIVIGCHSWYHVEQQMIFSIVPTKRMSDGVSRWILLGVTKWFINTYYCKDASALATKFGCTNFWLSVSMVGTNMHASFGFGV